MRLVITGVTYRAPEPICVPSKGESLTVCALHSHIDGPTPAPVVHGVLLLDGETEVADLVGRELTL